MTCSLNEGMTSMKNCRLSDRINPKPIPAEERRIFSDKALKAMIVSMTMNLINVTGNSIGILILRAGAAGVAWSTTISWYFAAVVMTWLCFNRENTENIAGHFREAGMNVTFEL